jgi:subtilase family serine protease
MSRILSAALVAAALTFGGATVASAQSATGLERSGNTFHMRVCPETHIAGMAACHAHVVTDSRGQIRQNERNVLNNALPSGFGPADLAAAYQYSLATGSTVTVAIVDAYGYSKAESDLAVYRSTFGLPACTTANGCFRKVNQTGGTSSYPKNNTGWDQEQALDLDMVSATCPSCHILLVQATNASFTNLGTAENTAAALGAHVISNSYGGGETGAGSLDGYYTHPGVAITVSSGDSGYGVQYPASSPHVTAVGGTSLSRASNSRGWSETVWNGAGSGCSTVFAKPSWQHDSLCGNRMEADVSAVADPNTGVAVYGPVFGNFSGWMVFGGTSVAAPLVGGLYGANAGSVNYGQDPYNHTGSLNDVTSGSNGSCGGTYFCTGGAGYDGPTGLGTPIGTSPF